MPLLHSLLLELYELDGVTVAWDVATDSAHARPYLADPDRYEGQSIDPAGGGATIATITVTVIDKASTPGDQATGWMTQRLAASGLPAVGGRRCRLRRYLGAVPGWQTILDGVAGLPKLNADYASYSWAIRDVREIERKYAAFEWGAGLASKQSPRGLVGVAAGTFLQNLYDGLFSRPDDEGNPVPSGVRYDAAALALMTTPVYLRLTEPITDVREWAESHIFAPLGWIPALDNEGRLSPVFQGAPVDTRILPLLAGAGDIEPSPDWDGGRVVNVLAVTYTRIYYDTAHGDGDGRTTRTVTLEYADEVSVALHGEQKVTIDASAFSCEGGVDGVSTVGLEHELGYYLARMRQSHLGRRYAVGAPVVKGKVRRDAAPTLRVGSWVRLDISWLPDYVTGLRGLIAPAQVVSLDALSLAWQDVTFEVLRTGDIPELAAVEISEHGGDLGDIPWTPRLAIACYDGDDESYYLTIEVSDQAAPVAFAPLEADWTTGESLYEDDTGLNGNRYGVTPAETHYRTYRVRLHVRETDELVTELVSGTVSVVFYEGGSLVVPVLADVVLTASGGNACAGTGPWILHLVWTVTNPNPDRYRLEVYRQTDVYEGFRPWLADVGAASGAVDDETSVQGNAGGVTVAAVWARTYRFRLVSRQTGEAVQEWTTAEIALTLYAEPCD